MEDNLEKCWLYDGCPCRSGGCYGLPDDGCPVYRWFKKVIEKQKAEGHDIDVNIVT